MFEGTISYSSRVGLNQAMDGPIPWPRFPTEWQPITTSVVSSSVAG